MKGELYMTSPEQEFSHSTVQEARSPETDVPPEQWMRLWDRNWIRLWDRNWIRLWDRNWIRIWERNWNRFWERSWIRWEPPWEIERLKRGEGLGEIEPIMERLLLRREKEGFLAMDSLTSRVFKLDEQAGKMIQLVQDGISQEEAAKKIGVNKKELEEFHDFLKLHDISTER